MSFQKDSRSTHLWKQWVNQNRQKLTELGIPTELFTNEKRWWYFLEHGYDEPTQWCPDEMSPKNAVILIDFLETEYPNGQAQMCLFDVRRVAEDA